MKRWNASWQRLSFPVYAQKLGRKAVELSELGANPETLGVNVNPAGELPHEDDQEQPL